MLRFSLDTSFFRLDLDYLDLILESTFLGDLKDAIGGDLDFTRSRANRLAGGLSGLGLIYTCIDGGGIGLYLFLDDNYSTYYEYYGYGYYDYQCTRFFFGNFGRL